VGKQLTRNEIVAARFPQISYHDQGYRWFRVQVIEHLSVAPNASYNSLPTAYNNLFDSFAGATNKEIEAWEGMANAYADYRDGGASSAFLDAVQTCAENVLVNIWQAENSSEYPLVDTEPETALDLLIRYMEDNNETVDACEPSTSTLVNGPNKGDITGATAANPVVITSTAHGLEDGDVVTIRSVSGMTEINDRTFTVNQTAANTFELVGEDGSGHTAYSSGGYWKANDGNAELIVSTKDGRGQTLESMIAEQIAIRVSDTSTAGSESADVYGELTDNDDPLSVFFTDGSAATASLTVLDPSADNALSNGDFETFSTTNTPDDWTVDTGTISTHIFEDTANAYRGSDEDDTTNYCLELVGDGSTLVTLSQEVTDLESNTPYPVSCRLKVDTSAPAAGVLVLELVDGNSSVISDEEGNSNQLSIDLTAANTTYEAYTSAFRLPSPLPATVTFRIRMTTALTNAKTIYLDDVFLGTDEMTQLYDGGPYLALVRGASDLGDEDRWIVDVTNDYRGDLQWWCRRLWNFPEKPLPSATGGSETIGDTVIT